jgi:hypothetical protein
MNTQYITYTNAKAEFLVHALETNLIPSDYDDGYNWGIGASKKRETFNKPCYHIPSECILQVECGDDLQPQCRIYYKDGKFFIFVEYYDTRSDIMQSPHIEISKPNALEVIRRLLQGKCNMCGQIYDL